MSVPVSVTPILSQGVGPEVARHTATFHPNFWGDRFLHYMPDEAFCVSIQWNVLWELRL